MFHELCLYIPPPIPAGFFLSDAESLLEQPFEMRRLQAIHEVSAHRGQDQYFQVLWNSEPCSQQIIHKCNTPTPNGTPLSPLGRKGTLHHVWEVWKAQSALVSGSGRVRAIKLFRISLILKYVALNENVGLHSACFLNMRVKIKQVLLQQKSGKLKGTVCRFSTGFASLQRGWYMQTNGVWLPSMLPAPLAITPP